MKRKDYIEPTIRIVKLQPRKHLLVGSDPAEVSAKRSGYGAANEGLSDGEDIWQ